MKYPGYGGASPAKDLRAVINGQMAGNASPNSDIYIYKGEEKLPSRVLDRITLKERPFKRGERQAHRRA